MILILQSLDGTMELNTLVYNKYSITISLFSFLKKKKKKTTHDLLENDSPSVYVE